MTVQAARCQKCFRTIIIKPKGRRICLNCQRSKRSRPSITLVVQGGYDVKVEYV